VVVNKRESSNRIKQTLRGVVVVVFIGDVMLKGAMVVSSVENRKRKLMLMLMQMQEQSNRKECRV
jgi:hypothetical protein